MSKSPTSVSVSPTATSASPTSISYIPPVSPSPAVRASTSPSAKLVASETQTPLQVARANAGKPLLRITDGEGNVVAYASYGVLVTKQQYDQLAQEREVTRIEGQVREYPTSRKDLPGRFYLQLPTRELVTFSSRSQALVFIRQLVAGTAQTYTARGFAFPSRSAASAYANQEARESRYQAGVTVAHAREQNQAAQASELASLLKQYPGATVTKLPIESYSGPIGPGLPAAKPLGVTGYEYLITTKNATQPAADANLNAPVFSLNYLPQLGPLGMFLTGIYRAPGLDYQVSLRLLQASRGPPSASGFGEYLAAQGVAGLASFLGYAPIGGPPELYIGEAAGIVAQFGVGTALIGAGSRALQASTRVASIAKYIGSYDIPLVETIIGRSVTVGDITSSLARFVEGYGVVGRVAVRGAAGAGVGAAYATLTGGNVEESAGISGALIGLGPEAPSVVRGIASRLPQNVLFSLTGQEPERLLYSITSYLFGPAVGSSETALEEFPEGAFVRLAPGLSVETEAKLLTEMPAAQVDILLGENVRLTGGVVVAGRTASAGLGFTEEEASALALRNLPEAAVSEDIFKPMTQEQVDRYLAENLPRPYLIGQFRTFRSLDIPEAAPTGSAEGSYISGPDLRTTEEKDIEALRMQYLTQKASESYITRLAGRASLGEPTLEFFALPPGVMGISRARSAQGIDLVQLVGLDQASTLAFRSLQPTAQAFNLRSMTTELVKPATSEETRALTGVSLAEATTTIQAARFAFAEMTLFDTAYSGEIKLFPPVGIPDSLGRRRRIKHQGRLFRDIEFRNLVSENLAASFGDVGLALASEDIFGRRGRTPLRRRTGRKSDFEELVGVG